MRLVVGLDVGVALALLLSGCAKEAALPRADPAGSPEEVYRQFMFANLEGTEAKIRPLIVDQPGTEILWQGPYPPDVAELLAAQYQSMDVVRVAEAPNRVTLTSTAAPTALDVVLQGQTWRVDPAPIIAFRKKAGK